MHLKKPEAFLLFSKMEGGGKAPVNQDVDGKGAPHNGEIFFYRKGGNQSILSAAFHLIQHHGILRKTLYVSIFEDFAVIV